MKRNDLRRRIGTFMLSLVLLLSVLPAAHAADDTSEERCSKCKQLYDRTVLKQANCHEEGVVEYICTNSACSEYQKSIIKKTAKDETYHDAVYRDNGDGVTHTATCRYHTEYRNVSEQHSFVNGYCTKCAAADYAQARIVTDTSLESYVSLNDAHARLVITDVKVMVGDVDVTDSYTVSYNWMNQTGISVGTGLSYYLPSDVTAKTGDYGYVCVIMAMPKTGTSGKNLSESCAVTVHVRELVSASAVVHTGDGSFLFSATNTRTEKSVMNQIYEATYKLSNAYPDYVVFGTKPTSTVGTLDVNSTPYYFTPEAGQQGLSAVAFTPSDTTTGGSYTINFTVHDTAGKDFSGILTVIVEKDLDALDVSYATTQGVPVQLSASDFAAFWQKNHGTNALNLIYFKSLPSTREGTLYYNYSTTTLFNTPVTTADMFYTTPTGTAQRFIDNLTFVPDAKFTGFVTIPFVQYGTTKLGQYATLSGNLTIYVSTGTIEDVSYSITSGETLTLSAEDFAAVYQKVTDTNRTDFSIKLLDTPANGALYVDYTGKATDTPLTDAVISDYTFYYSSTINDQIADLTYLCAKSTSTKADTLRYAVCDSRGELVYMGKLIITNTSYVATYTKSFSDVVKTASTEWYYTAVMELAEKNIIGGFEDGTYRPDGEVTYAQALKLIMLAAGYPVPEQTGSHWASGYLDVAKEDGLVSASLTESYLDRKIDRNTIAQIAARALNLPASSLTTSPFSDVTVGSTYAPYIFALYEAKIVQGDASGGTARYYGINSIRRSEMAVIVYRINNYKNS